MNSDSLYRELNEALRDAFRTPNKLAYMLRSRLSKRLNEIALADNFISMVAAVVDTAESEGWIDSLLLASLQENSGNVKLRALAQQISLVPSVSLTVEPEAIVLQTNSFIDVHAWTTRLSELESRVCRIETPKTYGTGFLVGPDLVITSYHVMQPIFEAPELAEHVRLRFDYKKLANGKILEGTRYRLAREQWWVDMSQPSSIDDLPETQGHVPQPDELDYVLLRTDGKPGYDEMSGKGRPNARRRHWIEIPTTIPVLKPNTALIILQYPSHPSPQPLKMAVDTQAIFSLNANGTRIRYRTNTEHGSSGAPCFTLDLEVVALHRAGNTTYNEGIPFSAIRALLVQRCVYEVIAQKPEMA